ncbi:MAG: glucosamine-6-phosphate deaminase [Butyrivibrio sp.]|nr:glucosamine-6-phosphate deaminase [Butyrivibrio sp.]
MKIIKAKDYEEMSNIAARIISAQILMKPDCVLGLATGSSPIGVYKRLIEEYKENALDFKKVKTVNLDEYEGLSGDNVQSYRYFMNTNLFDHVNIDKKNTMVPNGISSVELECGSYEERIEKLGGIDLQLLGIGRNGHIGFNEPDEYFAARTHVVNLTESTIEANARLFESKDEVPKRALTMGIGTIMKAKKIVLIASGEDKAKAVKDAVCGPVTPHCPASALQLHRDVVIVADAEALKLMP